MKRNDESKSVAMKVMSHEVLKINGVLSFIRTSGVNCSTADNAIYVSVDTLQIIDKVPVKNYCSIVDDDTVEFISDQEKLAFLTELAETLWRELNNNKVAGEGEL